ncbi:MAG: ketoacyl-ACP synthase III [Acidobacteria bacterium]|nr:ketoacyl-ACP synthase III [Acidobacteriota bacterium]
MAFLRGFGKYLPERVVDNVEMGALLGAEPDWIREMSGIETRRFAREDESVASMAVAAGVDALARSGVAASELGLILVSSGSGERRFPGPASEVQFRLGAPQAVAMDVPMASAGALFAMAMASEWAPRVGKVLVVAAEKMSVPVMTEPREKGTAMLFGDGAGACVVDRDQGFARMVDFELGTDGSAAGELKLDFGSPVHMNGRMVIMHAARKVPAAIATLLGRRGVAPADVRVFLMHQANANLLAKIAQTVGVDVSKFYSNIARYGNTSSASMLIAASEWDGGWDGPVVFAAFGAGFQWGAMMVEGA